MRPVTASAVRLAAVDGRARARVGRLLCLPPMDADVALRLAAGGAATLQALQVELDLSYGGAVALADRLERAGIVRRVPDPDKPWAARLRLTPAAQLELEIALAPLADELEASPRRPAAVDDQARARHQR